MLTEKQSTHRSPMRPVEVSYVSSDATEVPEGYQFNFPVGWTSQQSTNKMIGLRRLKYTPCAATISFWVTFTYYSTTLSTTSLYKTYTSQNTLEEIIADLNNTFKGSFTYGSSTIPYSLVFKYEPSTQVVTVVLNVNEVEHDGDFTIKFEANTTYGKQFRHIFNQREASTDITSVSNVITFTDVWNRQDLYFHSSFSDSTRQIIGVNGDFWEEPSVYYPAALNSNRFTIRFTQDTVTSIVPRYGVMLVQFCLIFNYLKFLD